jgi:hypothetical protein
MMMAANLVGFVVGLEGVSYLVGQLVGSWAGMLFLFVSSNLLMLTCFCLRNTFPYWGVYMLVRRGPIYV